MDSSRRQGQAYRSPDSMVECLTSDDALTAIQVEPCGMTSFPAVRKDGTHEKVYARAQRRLQLRYALRHRVPCASLTSKYSPERRDRATVDTVGSR
jgi:hypothetical protein